MNLMTEELGVFSDVHGEYMNVFEMAEMFPRIIAWISLGDLIDKDRQIYFNQPALRAALQIGAQMIRGNHEQKTARDRLSEYEQNNQELLRNMPGEITFTFGNQQITALHYLPTDPMGMGVATKLKPYSQRHDNYCAQFIGQGARTFLVGHTHVAHDIMIGETRVINPGSLGGKDLSAKSFAILSKNGDCRFVELPTN